MSELAKEKVARHLKKRESISSMTSQELRSKEATGKTKDSIGNVSFTDDHGHHDEIHRPHVQLENTYQLGPTKRFSTFLVTEILQDVLSNYLQEEKYEPELCRQMTKTISEVVKARVKEMMIPRYKIIVMIIIGQLAEQNMRVGSRCLWDVTYDTFSSYTFKNNSLFAVGNVYGVYTD